jgi:NADP-dependent aldehyde dehydrogenase
MLNEGISQAYSQGVATISGQPGVNKMAVGEARDGKPGFCGQPTLLSVSAADFIVNHQLTEEMFGPASILVRCRDLDELLAALKSLKGQLTGTIHAAAGEMADYEELIDELSQRVGRLLVNGFPTGVEVCHAMVHGGPFPATSDVRFTSVGTAAIKRFLRPICLQNFPGELFPEALQDSNPLNIWRLVNGERSRSPL